MDYKGYLVEELTEVQATVAIKQKALLQLVKNGVTVGEFRGSLGQAVKALSNALELYLSLQESTMLSGDKKDLITRLEETGR